jgi:hypothetical protein
MLSLGLGVAFAPALLRVLAWLVPAAELGPPLPHPPPLNLAVLLGFAVFALAAALVWSALLVAAADGPGSSRALAAAALTVEVYIARSAANLGPAPRHTVLLSVTARDNVTLTSAQAADFNQQALSRLERLSGMQQIALADLFPPLGFPVSFVKQGDAAGIAREATLPISVSPGYFRTLGIPILFGRGFDDTDHSGGEPVGIISLDMAEEN